MPFHSLGFLCVFLPVSLLAYYLTPRRFRNGTLLLISAAFYLLADPWYLPFAFSSVLLDYVLGRAIGKTRGVKSAGRLLAVGIAKDLALLLLIKQYVGFPPVFYERYPLLGLLVPLGLATYALKSISYLADVRQNAAPAATRFVPLALYLLFYPALPFGPILLYRDVLPQLDPSARRMNGARFVTSTWFFCKGLGKVVLLAGGFETLWRSVSGGVTEATTFPTALVGLLCVCLALYFFWSGSQDMAKGLTELYGFAAPKADDYPFLARGVTDFLCRIDRTLTRWLRTYAYDSRLTGGSDTVRWIVNIILFLVFRSFFAGDVGTLLVWLGAMLAYLLLDRVVYKRLLSRCGAFVQRLYTLVFVCSCGLILAMPDTAALGQYARALFRFTAGGTLDTLLESIMQPVLLMFAVGALLAISGVFSKQIRRLLYHPFRGVPWLLVPLQLVILLFCVVYLL